MMRDLTLFAVTTLLGLATASSNSSTLGLLKYNGVALGDWESAYDKASAFVGNLTTEQKLAIMTGSSVTSATNESFSALVFGDGDMGLQDFNYVSAFSLASAIAMTWDQDAYYQQAKAVGIKFYKKEIQVLNAPTSQPIGRTPWGGRFGETFGPDPYLNGLATGLSVKGYVETGVISGAKHFLLYEQETNRTSDPNSISPNPASGPLPYSSKTDDKTLHETYLWPFYDAVKNGLGAVMCAMTKVNNTLACQNSDLLLKHLKTELGFPGLVYPDTKAQSTETAETLNNGEDYGDSTYWSTSVVKSLLANDNGLQPAEQGDSAFVDVRGNHSKLIRKYGAQSMALLKNKNNALPLKTVRRMSIFGAHAGAIVDATGFGSGQASYPYLVTPLVPLTVKATEDGTILNWILKDNYTSTAGSSLIPSVAGSTAVSPSYATYAGNSDVCIVFLNTLAGEGADRTELYNPDQDTMVNTVADNCNNTIVVINTVGPRLLDQWIEHENVTAVLYGSLLGQGSGNSIVDVLYGDVNPSGRLIYSIPKNESDYNVGLCYTSQCNFTEGVYLDYRYFDAHNITTRFPFGHGLSYTSFSYSNLTISATPTGHLAVGGYSDLWDTVNSISVTINNTGSLSGAEIPQLYLSFPDSADQPLRQLRGFERVELATGEQKTATFNLRRREISYWNVVEQQWVVAAGEYKVYVGASSRDFKLHGSFTVQTDV
ncbi:putative beta-glucosidase D [Aspergillus ibericus CBS 121593]|uniref:beta-glucosidase n=1 Tax=Aspergillus ibericus CBS 121593 TaxID=1448316 RepID=A0A395GHM5_9EURO|nr:putative beta-glucosidase D [Aspergillus ibericus CBS 121593]RAK94911.1 putative beta-glucosidase D [Aspergillus ibericus CBS 121593]